jgi:hypothetical protein
MAATVAGAGFLVSGWVMPTLVGVLRYWFMYARAAARPVAALAERATPPAEPLWLELAELLELPELLQAARPIVMAVAVPSRATVLIWRKEIMSPSHPRYQGW